MSRATENDNANGRQRPRTAVVLSAGYFGFYAHAGFMQAIEECGIDYTAIAGSSAGAAVAALRMMERALAISRKEIERHRLQLLGELNERLTWIEPDVPRVSARDLTTGRAAMAAAYRYAKAMLCSQSSLDGPAR